MVGEWSCGGVGARVEYRLRGDFEFEEARALARDARERLAPLPPGQAELLFCFDELTRVSVEARSELALLQRWLNTQARRSVYLSRRPLFRGVALWIMHTAPDPSARVFSDRDQAEAWLEIVETHYKDDKHGGYFYTADDADVLAEEIQYTESGDTVFEERSLWDMPILFLLRAGLLGGEWSFRRWRDLA